MFIFLDNTSGGLCFQDNWDMFSDLPFTQSVLIKSASDEVDDRLQLICLLGLWNPE